MCNKRLLVVSHNIHKGLSPLNRLAQLPQLAQALQTLNPDVVCLQEVQGKHSKRLARFGDDYADNQTDWFGERLGLSAIYGQNANHRNGHHGNAVFSCYPIDFKNNLNISVNRFEQRGVLHCQLDVGGVAVAILNCHLNLLQKDRRLQYNKMTEYIANLDPTMPVVLAGDFNDWTKQSDLHLSSLGLVEVYQATWGDFATTFPAKKPTLSLDRLYVRHLKIIKTLTFQTEQWRTLSDHLPVGAVLAIE